jgi:hypothetical protein
LPQHIATSHVLVTQWDGFVVDARAWRDEFLACDYIGAPWPDQPASRPWAMVASACVRASCCKRGLDTHITQEHPEDLMLCREYRAWLEQHHGVRFASLDLARGFAFENAARRGQRSVFTAPTTCRRCWMRHAFGLVARIARRFFRSRDARRLARALLAQRMPQVATQLLAGAGTLAAMMCRPACSRPLLRWRAGCPARAASAEADGRVG